MISEENIHSLSQIFNALDDSVKKFEEYYKERDIENFKKAKNEILRLQKKASEILNQTTLKNKK